MNISKLPRNLQILPLLFFLLLALSSISWAATYYVATNGNDSNAGTVDNPWRTIQKAANSMLPGDSSVVNTGIYNERIQINTSGNAGSMITFLANGSVRTQGFDVNANYIKIEGFIVINTNCSWTGAIHVSGSHCLLSANTIEDSARPGIVIASNTYNCTVTGNTIRRCHVNGIQIQGTNHLMADNDVSDIRDHIGSCSLTIEANGIEFHGSGHTFRGNYIHDFSKANQNGQPHMDAFQTFDQPPAKIAASNCIIEHNHVFMGNANTNTLEEAWNGSSTIYGFMLEGSSTNKANNITIRNNIIEAWGGLNIGGGKNVTNLKIYNNTWRSSLSFSSSYWPTGIHLDQISTADVRNNITVDYSYAHYNVSGGSGISYDYNLMWNSNGSTAGLTGYSPQAHDKRSVRGGNIYNPIFVANFTNLQIQSNSPCVDSGTPVTGITYDYASTPRPQGAGIDIGAYEYSGTDYLSPPTGLRVVN